MSNDQAIETVKSLANEVWRTLGSGYSESQYAKALRYELREHGIEFNPELTFEVFYKSIPIGEQRADLYCPRHELVIELKHKAKIDDGSRLQLRSYLQTLGLRRGLLVNFPLEGDECEFEVVTDRFESDDRYDC